MKIEKYKDCYWEDLCRIHNAARKIELQYASLEAAYLPLDIAAEREGLFEYDHLDVAVEDGRPVGFCAYTDEEIAWLYVLPERVRQGIGRQLVENALAVEPGLCWVETLYGNEPANRLYESFGFTVREIVAGKMPGNEQFAVRVYRMYRDVSKLC